LRYPAIDPLGVPDPGKTGREMAAYRRRLAVTGRRTRRACPATTRPSNNPQPSMPE
jgi:hypothetical protein